MKPKNLSSRSGVALSDSEDVKPNDHRCLKARNRKIDSEMGEKLLKWKYEDKISMSDIMKRVQEDPTFEQKPAKRTLYNFFSRPEAAEEKPAKRSRRKRKQPRPPRTIDPELGRKLWIWREVEKLSMSQIMQAIDNDPETNFKPRPRTIYQYYARTKDVGPLNIELGPDYVPYSVLMETSSRSNTNDNQSSVQSTDAAENDADEDDLSHDGDDEEDGDMEDISTALVREIDLREVFEDTNLLEYLNLPVHEVHQDIYTIAECALTYKRLFEEAGRARDAALNEISALNSKKKLKN